MLNDSLRTIVHRAREGVRNIWARRMLDARLRRVLEGKIDFHAGQFISLLGYTPRNWRLFVEALLHRSFLPHMKPGWRSNERLEFLGDAILNLLVADHLYQTRPDVEEGELTKIRSRLVNRKTLASRAKDIDLGQFLILSSSALQSVDSGSDSILCDAYEAVIGAVYLDGGLERTRNFVERTLLKHEETIRNAFTDDNYKSALMEYSQSRSMGVPRYTIVKEEGPDHDRRFTVEVFLGTQSLGVGRGRSKKDAEQAAAAVALKFVQHYTIDSPEETNHDA